MANTVGLVARRFNTVSLIKITLALYIAAAPAYSYAIDPISGAWAADAAASAALGGSGTGARALGLAVEAAAGAGASAASAAAAAAAIAGVGIGAYCLTSWAIGVNDCGGGSSAMSKALGGAGISVNPADGSLVRPADPYYTSLIKPFTTVPPAYFSSPSEVCNWIAGQQGAYYSYYKIEKTVAASGAVIKYTNGAGKPTHYNCNYIETNTKDGTTKPYSSTDVGVTYPNKPVPAEPPDIAAAVSGNPAAAAAAAAAVGAEGGIGAAEAAAAAAAAAPAINTPANCASKGMKSGTFQGATYCVGDASGSNSGTGDLGGEVGDTGTGTGTGTGAENPPANPPATETPAFCGWAVTLCAWLDWTKTDPVAKTQAETKVDIKDRQTTDIPNLPVGINTTRISWSQQCPSPITANFNLMGQSVDWQYKFDTVCDFAAKFRPYVIGLSYLTAAYIVMGLNRTRSE